MTGETARGICMQGFSLSYDNGGVNNAWLGIGN